MLTKKEMWPVMLTPFTERGEVDYNALERLIAFYEEGGCSGLFAICQSSEVFYLSLEERVKIADFVKKHASLPVIASGHVSDDREAQLEELRLNQLGPKAITYDGMPHGTELGDLSDYMAKYDEIEQAIIKARYRRISAFQWVRDSIEALEDDREKELLTLRYLRGMKWEEIAVNMGYSWRKIHYLHGEALEHFEICA